MYALKLKWRNKMLNIDGVSEEDARASDYRITLLLLTLNCFDVDWILSKF